MTTQAQVQTVDGPDPGLILAVGTFPAGSIDSTLEVRDVRPDQEPKLEQPGAKHMAADGTITVTPPPPPPIVYAASLTIGATVRTIDGTPHELLRFPLDTETGYDVAIRIMGIDASNGVMKKLKADVTMKRLLAGPLQVGATTVLVTHQDAAAASWALGVAFQGNDAVLSVTGAAGRTIDWLCAGDVGRYAPGGLGA